MSITSLTNIGRRALLVVTALAFVVSPVAAIVGHANAITAPRAQISFTFDDGLNSALSLAAPVLQSNGFTGTDYVISNCAGMTTTPNTCGADENKSYMTWDQIKTLRDTYGWEIGSHTKTHPLLDPNDATVPASEHLTAAQITDELQGSQAAILANTGKSPTAFAAPYGSYDATGQQVIAEAAKYYTSFRGFHDYGYNDFPFNNFLIRDIPVQDGALLRGETTKVDVTRVKQYIDNAVANKQWLVLTFHDIMNGNAATGADDYDLNVDELRQIAEYAKSVGITNTNVSDALVSNPGGGNLATDSSFDTAISPTVNSATWSTDTSASVSQNTANHGSTPSATNSASIANSGATDTHLFSNTVKVEAKPYVIQAFLNVQQILTTGELRFVVDEYDANGVYVGQSAKYLGSILGSGGAANPLVRTAAYQYTPSAGVAFARLQVIAMANSGSQSYVDNVQWFAQDGSTLKTSATADINGDGRVDALDLSVVLGNFNKTGQTATTGDLTGDGTVDALDLSVILTNWSK